MTIFVYTNSEQGLVDLALHLSASIPVWNGGIKWATREKGGQPSTY